MVKIKSFNAEKNKKISQPTYNILQISKTLFFSETHTYPIDLQITPASLRSTRPGLSTVSGDHEPPDFISTCPLGLFTPWLFTTRI